jgi:lincosamide nucleotidyltransferase A/C/D/E
VPAETDAATVLHLVRRWTRDDVPFWVAGGWGVDALVGRRTRRHADLDVVLHADRFDAVLDELLAEGFAVATDWRPVRIEVAHADGRRVDLHPLTPHPDGGGTQPGLDGATFRYPPDAFATGTVDGVAVPCLSVRQQVAFHQGYDPRPQDVHDLALLHALDGG